MSQIDLLLLSQYGICYEKVVLIIFLSGVAGPTDASPVGKSSVSNPVVMVQDFAVEGIWLHKAWPQEGRQDHNIHPIITTALPSATAASSIAWLLQLHDLPFYDI